MFIGDIDLTHGGDRALLHHSRMEKVSRSRWVSMVVVSILHNLRTFHTKPQFWLRAHLSFIQSGSDQENIFSTTCIWATYFSYGSRKLAVCQILCRKETDIFYCVRIDILSQDFLGCMWGKDAVRHWLSLHEAIERASVRKMPLNECVFGVSVGTLCIGSTCSAIWSHTAMSVPQDSTYVQCGSW